ncbi:adp-heptose--lipooligosaccharide heptosyltransferase ii [hydrocarbon metagenome]|uniref:Adp-heptose--lipooligosaccharide heptosyltransferase ii n=1 Tax=hydrocarbon metagenome TaxID=938273 RepID=A0A0W8G017_9ZZZZ
MTKSKQKRILIARPDRVGDVVLSTPIPRELKKTFPNSFVAVLVRSYTKDIFLNNPFVDEIIIADEILSGSKKNILKWVGQIRKFKFTHALMLLPNERINYLLFLAGIRTRIGVGHKFFQFITGVKSVSRNKYIPLRHEADYCMDLARKIGVENADITPRIFLSEEEKEKLAEKRKSLLGEKKYLIGIHSTSGNSAPNWTPDYYADLIKLVIPNNELQVVCTDQNVPEVISEISGVRIPKEVLSKREFWIFDLLVSASTGPMHVCAALGIKTVSIFCPLTACSPELWGPLGNESIVVMPEENYCQTKCPGDPKVCTFSGEGGISPAKVYEDVLKLLYQ